MIEPTDASKCDERQVKNKPNRLTHKKEGERHTMSTQSMKIWKLGAFFVVSLMLVVGLFSDVATAQNGRVGVKTDPSLVKAGSILDSVTVTYTVGLTAIEDGNTVEVSLPTSELTNDWGPAYANDGGTDAQALALRLRQVMTAIKI